MDSIISVLENIWRYLTLIRITDVLDISIMSFAIYKLLSLVRSTRAENILKGIVIFILALWLSSLLNLRGINYILSYVVEWGVLALFVVFQPELRRGLEQLGSKNIRLLRFLTPEQRSSWKRLSTRLWWPARRCPGPVRACLLCLSAAWCLTICFAAVRSWMQGCPASC